MINELVVGSCILMNGFVYKIHPVFFGQTNVVKLGYTVIVHEQKREYLELWKASYVRKVSKRVKCP